MYSPSDKISNGRQRRADRTEEGGNGGALFGVVFFRAARCRRGDVTSSAPLLGLTVILSCLVDSRGSGRYSAGWLTYPD